MRTPFLSAIALALLALCLPQSSLVGEAFAGGFEHSPLWAIWHRTGWTVGQVLDCRGEQVRFVIAALAYGCSLGIAIDIARGRGCSPLSALVAGSVALLAPTAWIAGTTPGMASIGLLFGLLLMRTLLRDPADHPWRSLGLWGLWSGTQISALLLWPAVAAACLAPYGRGAERRLIRLPFAFMSLGIATVAVAMNLSEWDPVPLPTELDATATRWSLDAQAWTRLAGILPGMGIAIVGLLTRRRGSPSASRSRSAPWVLLWCALPGSYLLLNSTLTWDASYHWLLPIALLGLSDFLTLPVRERKLAVAAGLLVAQAGLLLAFQRRTTLSDPLTPWRERTRPLLDSMDTVITGDVRHGYLASHRWGLRSVILRATDPSAPSTRFVDGIYTDPAGQTNLRIKTQDVAAWAEEGVEARGFGFRAVLDRPFPEPARGISAALEREIDARIPYLPIDSD